MTSSGSACMQLFVVPCSCSMQLNDKLTCTCNLMHAHASAHNFANGLCAGLFFLTGGSLTRSVPCATHTRRESPLSSL